MESGSVGLSFDDGPARGTAAVLDELARCGAAATFFVVPGSGAELIGRMVDEGHSVGYHCGAHVRHSERERDDVRREALEGLDWLERLGVRPGLWRPPWGDLAPWSADLAADLGLEIWLWSNDTEDWSGRGTARMLADLQRDLSGGSVVLMHDGVGPGALRSDVPSTVALVAPLVELCRERGLEPSPLEAREPVDA